MQKQGYRKNFLGCFHFLVFVMEGSIRCNAGRRVCRSKSHGGGEVGVQLVILKGGGY